MQLSVQVVSRKNDCSVIPPIVDVLHNTATPQLFVPLAQA
jgi:hypothetical protein